MKLMQHPPPFDPDDPPDPLPAPTEVEVEILGQTHGKILVYSEEGGCALVREDELVGDDLGAALSRADCYVFLQQFATRLTSLRATHQDALREITALGQALTRAHTLIEELQQRATQK